MSQVTESAAPAADLDEAAALALFNTMSEARFDPTDDPQPLVATADDEHADESAAAMAAAAADVPAEVPAVIPAAAPAATVTDIWSSATPEVRAAHAAALEERDQKIRSDIGRQAALQRKVLLLEEQLAGRSATPAATTAETATTPTSLRERPSIKKALEDYPETGIGEVVEALDLTLAENARLGRELSTITEDRRTGVMAAQEQALTAAHPDWVAATGSKEFADWLTAQPASVKQIVERNGAQVVDAEEAIAMVGAFKAHFALTHPPIPQPVIPTPAVPTPLAARRAAQLEAVTTTVKGAPVAVPDGAPGGSDEALFNHYVAKKAAKG
jgi:hypothetical protein